MIQTTFREKKEYLLGAIAALQDQDALAEEISQGKTRLRKLTRAITSAEKAMEDEISGTLKKRKQEIHATYDGRLEDNRSRKKTVLHKRDKKRNERMDARYKEETKDLHARNREMRMEMTKLLRTNKLPSFCGSKLYFVLFYAQGASERLLQMLAFFCMYVCAPVLSVLITRSVVMKQNPKANVAFWCVVVAALWIIGFLLIYFAIYNFTRLHKVDAMSQIREIRTRMDENSKQADAIRTSIQKDKDDSQYNLEAYDEKLSVLEKEAQTIGKEKQKALKTFESETVSMITDEIKNRKMPQIENLRQEKQELEDALSKQERLYDNKVDEIETTYISHLGQDLCRKDRLQELLQIMEDGRAQTVSEAILVYKNQ